MKCERRLFNGLVYKIKLLIFKLSRLISQLIMQVAPPLDCTNLNYIQTGVSSIQYQRIFSSFLEKILSRLEAYFIQSAMCSYGLGY